VYQNDNFIKRKGIAYMRIKKIKITKYNQVHMVYEQGPHNGDEYSFTCSEKARPELYTALAAMAEFVLDMCELPETYLDRIAIRGVTYSYGGDNDTMGAVISASMKLEESYQALNLVTPHKASAMYCPETPDDDKQLLTGDCVKALEELRIECEKYIQGDRAQGSLFADDQPQETATNQTQVH
jgi:hypothetical protein